MSFGRKGLAGGAAAAAHPGGGFGRAQSTAAPAPRPEGDSALAGDDEMAARREAFIAAERERAAGQVGVGEVSDVASAASDDLAALRNGARAARPAGAPRPSEPLGENGLPKSQEEKIKAMAREMSKGSRSKGSMASSSSSSGYNGPNPWAGKKSYVFGDPLKRNLGIAYVLWYFAGGFGVHRAYCGYMESGIYQFVLLVASIVISLIFLPLGLIGFLAWLLWMFADLFLMPGMMRRFKAAHEAPDTSIFE